MRRTASIFYGWRILCALWVIYFLSFPMICYGMNILTVHMVKETGKQAAMIGWTSSAFFAGQMIFGIVAGAQTDKRGARFSLIQGCCIIAGGCLCMYLFEMSVIGYLLFAMALGAGTMYSGVVTGPALINAWFDQNKALPMSIFMMAGACGGFVMPVVSEAVSARIGWRNCWGIYVFMAIAAALFSIFFIRNRPEEIGEVRDGIQWRRKHNLTADRGSVSVCSKIDWQDIIKNKKLPPMSVMIFGTRLLFSAFTSYLVFIAMENGISASKAAAALSAYHICGVIGRLAAGYMIQIPVNIVNGIVYMGIAAGGILFAVADTVFGFFAASIVMGLFYNYSYTFYAAQLPRYFGNQNYASYFSIINTIGGSANTISPILISAFSGIVGYQTIFMIMSGITALCAILAVYTKPVQ